MFEKISKVIFWLLSIRLLGGMICLFINKNIIDAIIFLMLAIITNPYIVDRISMGIGANKIEYSYMLKLLLIVCGIIVAYLISERFYFCMNLEDTDTEDLQDFRAILKMSVYVIYLIVLFVCKSSNKYMKYIIFGIFYSSCILLSFATDTIQNYIINILNYLPDSDLDSYSYDILTNDFLVPIKESILTYIIFDTIIKYKNDCNSKNQRQGLIEEENNLSEHSNRILSVIVQDDCTIIK